MIKFLTPKIKVLKKLNIPFLLNFSSKYNYKYLKTFIYKSYYDLYIKYIRYICYNYCITYKQYIYYKMKLNIKSNIILFFKLLYLLESRLDIILLQSGCFKTVLQARHYIKMKYIYVNTNNTYYYNLHINPLDIIFFNSKIKYIILKNLLYKFNIYIYINNIYIYNYIKIYSYNNFYLICIFNLKLKILYSPTLNNIWYIYNTIYYI